ncbi:MAG: CRISPR-associated helicase Cas3' [Oscillospiraceae bacterium]|jgi:CRISPR-associated endonuclease/helicase Cas3|nr:CRISPR-associated helicase Cas3' [Oscillospiraceae bacterium]
MGADIKIFKSHPDKFLLDHIQGVRENVILLTKSKIAELIAIFHDLGKMNPNFQNKVQSGTSQGYSNHAYLSAYAFFCAFAGSSKNLSALKQFLHVKDLYKNDLIALTVLIARHHGNLPDFCPAKKDERASVSILSKEENQTLFRFLKNNPDIPIVEYVNHFFSVENFESNLVNTQVQTCYADQFIFNPHNNCNPLDFFLDYQFVFASILQADKADAGKIGNIIKQQHDNILDFSQIFSLQLDLYLSKLKQNSALNRLRTTIRNDATDNIQTALKDHECVFELTAPTGSGKTLMLLSLAAEIIKSKGAKRIIYALPFLSITEQIETEILKIFPDYTDYIQRVDSKSENHRFEELQKELDNAPDEEKILELNVLEFQENTFAYPLIITTFVRFFETLLSNRNAELLRLPNFSNCIFLLDEIQVLPPRLYGFFIAYLKKFCQKFNSFAIVSTATQPNFNLPEDNLRAKEFFYDYSPPKSLLSLGYFENDLFNRYTIEYKNEHIDLNTLENYIVGEKSSVLVILNTIDDTKELFEKLKKHYDSDELFLLNTHFTPRHRKLKIYLAKRRLNQNKRVVVISTQLIEAGVDIDFPVLYRDFATVASIVQSAGRCNRNGKLPNLGKVVLFKLEKNGKLRSELIYQNKKDNEILTFTKQALEKETYQEKNLLQVQCNFFKRIQTELNFAEHSQNNPKFEFDFLQDIKECMFDKIGNFQLIDKQLFGEELQYYVAKNEKDRKFEELLELQNELFDLFKNRTEISYIRNKKRQIELHLKKMSNQIVQIRLKKNQIKPLQGCECSCFSLHKIDSLCYSFKNGIELDGNECII